MTIETQDDVEGLRRIGRIVTEVLERMLAALEPGMATAELDELGRRLLAEAGSIAGHFEPRDPRVLREGMVITIEPFLSTRSTWVSEAEDGWTLRAPAGNLSAQYEHTLIVTRGSPIVVTAAAA